MYSERCIIYPMKRTYLKIHLMDACEAYARRWAKKEEVELGTLSEWIKSIGYVLKRRIRRRKHSVNTRHESIFSDPDVVTELSCLHENFVIVLHHPFWL